MSAPASARAQTGSLLAGYAVAGVFWGAAAAAAPDLQAISGFGPGGFGLALGAMSLAALPVMQALGPRIGRAPARAIPLSMAAFAAGNLVLAGAAGPAMLVAALVILGAASGALDMALNLRAARIEEETGARLFNAAHAVFPLAMLAAAAGTGWLRAVGVGIGPIFAAVALGFALVAAAEARAGAHQGPLPARGDGVGAAGGGWAGVGLLGLLAALAAFQEVAPQSWGAIYVETQRGGGPALGGLAPAAFVAGLAAGRLVAHAVEAMARPRTILGIAGLLALPAFAATALAPPVWAVPLALFVAGCGVGPAEPAVFRAAARDTAPERRGPVLARVTQIAYLGYLLSPPMLGWIAATAGFAAMWLTAAAASGAVAVLAFGGRGRR